MTSSEKTTNGFIIQPVKGARWSQLHDHLHDLIQILLEQRLEASNAGSYTLTECRYAYDAKSDDGYSMHFVLRLKVPGPAGEYVLVGLSLAASVTGIP